MFRLRIYFFPVQSISPAFVTFLKDQILRFFRLNFRLCWTSVNSGLVHFLRHRKMDSAVRSLHFIFGDQLSHSLSSFEDFDPKHDYVLMCEVIGEARYVTHHKKKIAFLFSAMRHFAEELRQKGYPVIYKSIQETAQSENFTDCLRNVLSKHDFDRIIVTHPSEYRVLKEVESWRTIFQPKIVIKADTRFLTLPEEFRTWAEGRKQLRMEYFYREVRQRYGILMDGDAPLGGKWNYDTENRKPPKANLTIPTSHKEPIDEITQDVIDLVGERFGDHFGDLLPFHYAVSHAQAKAALARFIKERLIHFGDYQDAMIQGEAWMFHAHIGLYLNCGLLLPMECIEAAENAYHQGQAPLNSVEGFIRQIIGWREYVRGIYWLKMPEYAELNYFNSTRSLPAFYWTAETEMNCLKQCIKETRENAYAHHIQRLMVLGNFALIAGLSPNEVNEWFLIVYADAYEWVELPNVSGMVLFADGGFLASKPYAAGGSYINKMSNYCKSCQYKVSLKNGPDACPFNYLYWDFLARNRDQLSSNHRIGMMYRTYDRMGAEKQKAIELDSARFFDTLE